MMRARVTRPSRPGPQSGFEVLRCKLGWIVQRWESTPLGRTYDPRILGGPFKSKGEAVQVRRKLIRGEA